MCHPVGTTCGSGWLIAPNWQHGFKCSSSTTRYRRGPTRMKYFFSFLCVLFALCGYLSAQDFKSVHDGVEYAEVTREISGQRVK